MVRLSAADLRGLADTLDAFDKIERETLVAVTGYDRNYVTTPGGQVVRVNRVDVAGQSATEGPATYVVEVDEQ